MSIRNMWAFAVAWNAVSLAVNLYCYATRGHWYSLASAMCCTGMLTSLVLMRIKL